VPVAATPTRGLGGLYWRLWSASSASALGDGLRRVALPLLAVHLTTNPRLVALAAAAGTVPWLVFALPIGALVDRFDRRRTMAAVDLLRTLTVALLAVAVAAGALSIALLVAVTFVLGTGEIFAESAALALVPQLVDTAQLERANGRLQAGEVTAGQFAGQGLGGALFAVALALPFALDAATFLLSAVLVLSLRTATRHRPPAASLRRLPAETAEGLRWLARHRLLRTCASCSLSWPRSRAPSGPLPRSTPPASWGLAPPALVCCSPSAPPGHWPAACSPNPSPCASVPPELPASASRSSPSPWPAWPSPAARWSPAPCWRSTGSRCWSGTW